jgi:hypothetical protein
MRRKIRAVTPFDNPVQFQQKCDAVLRPELRKNKEMEHFRDSGKNGNALRLFSS